MPNFNEAFNFQRFFFVRRVLKLKIHVSRQVKQGWFSLLHASAVGTNNACTIVRRKVHALNA
jgi:hypothetical protein